MKELDRKIIGEELGKVWMRFRGAQAGGEGDLEMEC